jgi:dipeptide transport system ATP-binding protein
MNQRVMIAMAIACNPRLLIADEPTTALDVTIQAQILDLLRDLQKERGMALVLITHNMGVVSEMAQRIAVMYAGQVMEQQRVDRLFASPQHPYTEALLAALPERGARAGWPPSAAWCRACTTGPRAACSRRAAATSPSIRLPGAARRCASGRAARCAATTRWASPRGWQPSETADGRRPRAAMRLPRRMSEVVVEARNLQRRSTDPPRHVPRAGAAAGGGRHFLHASSAGARWPWSASRAAASRRWRAWSR